MQNNVSQNLFSSVKKLKTCPENAQSEILNLLDQGANPTVTNTKEKTPIHKLLSQHEKLLYDINTIQILFNGNINNETFKIYRPKHLIYQNLTYILIKKGLEFDDMFITYETDTIDSIIAMQNFLKKEFSHIIKHLDDASGFTDF